MVGIILVSVIVSYALGNLTGRDDSDFHFQGGIITVTLCVILFFIHYSFNHTYHPLWGDNKPKFYLKEHALMKDNTIGRIDAIYYEIEGKLINQDSLK